MRQSEIPRASDTHHVAENMFTLWVDGQPVPASPGQSVAGALLAHGLYRFRSSPNATQPRGPFCMIGVCQECAIMIDGAIRRACQVEVRDAMQLHRHGAGMAREDTQTDPESCERADR